MIAGVLPRVLANERGSLLIGTLALLLMLTGFLMAASRGVICDTDAATRYRWHSSAFYVSEAGLEYGVAKLAADSAWTGLPAPGRNCQEGSFVVAVTTFDESGNALPAGEKRLLSTATVYEASAQTSLIVRF